MSNDLKDHPTFELKDLVGLVLRVFSFEDNNLRMTFATDIDSGVTYVLEVKELSFGPTEEDLKKPATKIGGNNGTKGN